MGLKNNDKIKDVHKYQKKKKLVQTDFQKKKYVYICIKFLMGSIAQHPKLCEKKG